MMNTEVTRADTEFIADIDLIFKLAYYVHRRFSNIVNKKVFFFKFRGSDTGRMFTY